MRLLIFTDASDIGGSEKFVGDLVEVLDRDRFEVLLAGNRFPRFDAWLAERLRPPVPRHAITLRTYNTSLPVRARRWLQARLRGGAVAPAPPNPLLVFDPQAERLSVFKSAITYAQMLPNLVRMWRLFRRLKPDVLHVNNGGYPGSRSCQMAPLAAKAAGVPRVVSFVHAFAVRPTVNSRIENMLDRLVDARVDVWATAAEGARDRLAEVRGIDAARIDVVYLGQPTSTVSDEDARAEVLARLGIDPEVSVVFCVGILRPMKGQADAIEALADVLATGRRCHLVLVGEGADRTRLEEVVCGSGLERDVTFLGHRDDVDELLNGCDILVSASTGFELLPYAIKEAMAKAVAVVATDVGGTAELVGDEVTGVLVPPGEPAAMAVALNRLIDDPALRLRMGLAGRDRIMADFSPSAMAVALQKLYAPPGG